MKQLLIKFLKFLLVVYVFVFAYEWWRPMPEDFAKVAQSYSVPEKGVRFYADIEKKDN
jgi:hypothetical protein